MDILIIDGKKRELKLQNKEAARKPTAEEELKVTKKKLVSHKRKARKMEMKFLHLENKNLKLENKV